METEQKPQGPLQEQNQFLSDQLIAYKGYVKELRVCIIIISLFTILLLVSLTVN